MTNTENQTNQPRMIAAAKLLAALTGVLAYAENEAFTLEKLKDSPEAIADAERAWQAVETACAAIAEATTIFPRSEAVEPDIHALLARQRKIAAIWGVEDVQGIRPDLTADQAWEVLQKVDREHDAELGITWLTLEMAAESLFDAAPETDEAEEA